jgi:hypothetical protein
VLYGDLALAVKRESAEAVMHFWGVKANTVWLWRKTLGVGQYNEGTTALKSELTSPVLDKAREASRLQLDGQAWNAAPRSARRRRESHVRRTSSRR